MNELYNETVVRNGITYHYDPDRDIYYRRYSDESVFSQWAWLVLVLVLAIAAVWLEHRPGLV
jgi:hypothetical protein